MKVSTLLLITAGILLIPLVAMQFTDEVNWSNVDFVVAGVLLFTTGFILSFIWEKFGKSKYRILYGVLVLLVFILIWAELAVGIFGSRFAGS